MPRRFPGRFNLFQRTMLRWRDIAPYNAVHAARVAGAIDERALREAIEGAVLRWRIAAPAIDPRRRRFAWCDAASFDVPLALHAAGDAPDDELSRVIEGALNAPFAPGAPLRFFAVDAGTSHVLGIAYDHYIAGGDSIAALLGEIVARLASDPARPRTPPPPPPALYPPTYAGLLRHEPRWFARALAAMPALVAESKRAMRPRDRDPGDSRNAYRLFRLSAPEHAALRARAHASGATVHDLVLAIALRASADIAGPGRHASARPDVAVAAIVNMRRDFGEAHARDFGQFLASMRIVHPVPPGAAVEALARDVHAITEANKRGRLYLRTLFGLSLAALAWPLLSPQRRLRFFAKHHPAWAGVSMLQADPAWPDGLRPAQDYTRGVSTGPLTPAVLAISQTRDAMSVGVSWRRSVLPDDFAARIEREFRACARTS